jgi:hypothetical protein
MKSTDGVHGGDFVTQLAAQVGRAADMEAGRQHDCYRPNSDVVAANVLLFIFVMFLHVCNFD